MKKFVSLLLLAVMVFSMSVSAFASDTYSISGVWYWNDTISGSGGYGPNGTSIYEAVNFVYDGVSYHHMEIYGTRVQYWNDNGHYDPTVSQLTGTSVNFGSAQTVSYAFYNWFTSNAHLDPNANCDGTSCPANDVNIDGICDDCGMVLSLSSLTYPVFPSVDGSNKHYALVKTKYSGVDAYMYSVFTSGVTYDISGEAPSTVYQIAVDGVADYSQYVTTDGRTWVEIQNSSVNNQSVGSGIVSQTTVIASTFDWYNEEGEHFFPVPLWEEVQSVTQGEMGGLTAEMDGTLKVLVPCGVGLMALLVGLSLFGKRSLLFLR